MSSKRFLSGQFRFLLDTRALYGPQRAIRSERCQEPSELDLINVNSTKNQYDRDTALLYGENETLHRACSVPKGIPISQKSKYLRQLFRIPRGVRISAFPQAYVPTTDLGVRKKKEK